MADESGPRRRRRKKQGDDAPTASAAVTSLNPREPEVTRSFLDRIRDAVTPSAIRSGFQRLHRRIGITKQGGLALLGAVLLWIIARVVAGTAMYLIAYGLLIMVLVAVFLAPRGLRLSAIRDGLFPRAQENDRLDVGLEMTAERSLSTFLLEERVPERLGSVVRVPITRLGKGKTVTHRYGLRCRRRGVYEVGPMVAIASDPLGLAERETLIRDPYELLVHPEVNAVDSRPLTRQFEDPPLRPPISRRAPSGTEFYGLREYVPGDDLRRINWRATAKTGTTMVREAEQGITDRVTLILDTNRGVHSQLIDGTSETFELGIRACASLAVTHLRLGYEVTVRVNDGPLTRTVRGASNQLLVLDALARLELSRTPLDASLRSLAVAANRDAHNILISPHLDGDETISLKMLLDTGVSVQVVALVDADLQREDAEESLDILGTAAGLGCQVSAVHVGDNIGAALNYEINLGR